MSENNSVKIQTYCPREAADAVRLAIGEAGGGVIGNYTHCTFVTEGYGYFQPGKEANPAVGSRGQINRVPEVKIEFQCARDKVAAVVAAIKDAHPYEEVPIHVVSLLNIKEFSPK